MKLIKWILNLLLLAISFCIISLCTFGIYSAVVYQSDDTSARISLVNKEDSVDYWDTWELMADDISVNVTNTQLPAPKLRVASWFSWSWWKTAGQAVDTYFVNPIVAIVKPIILPVDVADEIKNYYDKDITYFVDYINESEKSASDFHAMALVYFGVDIDITSSQINEEQLIANKDAFTLANALGDKDGNGITDVFDIADDYNYFYQLLFKLYKYNQVREDGTKVYEKRFNKYIIITEDGDRILSTGVYGLYFLNYTNIILAILFVRANPISITRNEDGTVSPRNNTFSRLSWKHKRRKEKKSKETV